MVVDTHKKNSISNGLVEKSNYFHKKDQIDSDHESTEYRYNVSNRIYVFLEGGSHPVPPPLVYGASRLSLHSLSWRNLCWSPPSSVQWSCLKTTNERTATISKVWLHPCWGVSSTAQTLALLCLRDSEYTNQVLLCQRASGI